MTQAGRDHARGGGLARLPRLLPARRSRAARLVALLRPARRTAVYGGNMADGQVPYRDFFDEYPPLAQPVFLLGRVAGAAHYALAFKALMAAFGVGAIACAVVTLRALRVTLVRAGRRGRGDRCLAAPRRPDLPQRVRPLAGVSALARADAARARPAARCVRRPRRRCRGEVLSGCCPAARAPLYTAAAAAARALWLRRRGRARASAVRDPRPGRAALQLLAADAARARAEQHRRRVSCCAQVASGTRRSATSRRDRSTCSAAPPTRSRS